MSSMHEKSKMAFVTLLSHFTLYVIFRMDVTIEVGKRDGAWRRDGSGWVCYSNVIVEGSFSNSRFMKIPQICLLISLANLTNVQRKMDVV